MALLGSGLVVIWNDVAWAGRDTFYRWHNGEHMPERVAIDGFLRGRRYVRDGLAEIEWLTLYETQTLQVLSGDSYLDRLNNPTPWTLEAVSHFRNVTRALTRVERSLGEADGGVAMVAGYMVDQKSRTVVVDGLGACVEDVANQSGICAAHMSVTDAAASSVVTAERRVRGNTDEAPDLVVLIEASVPGALCRAQALLDAAASSVDGLSVLRAPGHYSLEHQLEDRRPAT